MNKKTSQYMCSQCGETTTKWMGQCPSCKEWNTLTEAARVIGRQKKGSTWAGAASASVSNLEESQGTLASPRVLTGINEFDRALGGGMVQGSVVLLGGDPGIGKSTLLLQTLAGLSAKDVKALYVTGEESLVQVSDRAVRLGLPQKNLRALSETDLEAIIHSMTQEKPQVVVIDSIQTVRAGYLESAAGTVSQVRECASVLTRYAKENGCAVFLVGHVTKGGDIAGPRVLEHLVDTVLYFEGDPQSQYRLVRALKNRFGAVNELGAFEMTEQGLLSVDNPSALFLAADRRSASGSCVFVLQEGPRPLLIELQALMDTTTASNPRRLAVGVDANRLNMLLAVLHKHGNLDVGTYDVFANAVGGIKANEPAADLPMVFALVSSLREKSLPTNLACFGEVGLTGEVRPVQHAQERIKEAAKLGFKRIIVPQRNLPKSDIPNIEISGVANLAEALKQLAEWSQ